MIRVVDYGLGNVRAFINVFRELGIPSGSARTASELQDATRLVLPGVGAFDHAMLLLNSSGMRPQLEALVWEREVPVLGVCVGMQILCRGSDEGKQSGLGWVDAQVKSLARPNGTQAFSLDVPHMGWNDIRPKGDVLFRGLEQGALFYFLHSYYVQPESEGHVSAETDYWGDFASAIRDRNVRGVQFHPEKSHRWGRQVLRNFGEL